MATISHTISSTATTVTKNPELEARIQERLCLPERIRHAFAEFATTLISKDKSFENDCSTLQGRIDRNPLQTPEQKLHAAIAFSWLFQDQIQSKPNIAQSSQTQLGNFLRPLLPPKVTVPIFQEEMAQILEELFFAEKTLQAYAAFSQDAGALLQQMADTETKNLQAQEQGLLEMRTQARAFFGQIQQEMSSRSERSQTETLAVQKTFLERLHHVKETGKAMQESLHTQLQRLKKLKEST